jgi:hypothetical protein
VCTPYFVLRQLPRGHYSPVSVSTPNQNVVFMLATTKPLQVGTRT